MFSFKKDFANFQVKVQKIIIIIKKTPKKQKNNTGRIRKTFKANKNKCQKPFEENKILKEKFVATGKERQIKKEKITENRL